MVPEGRLAAAAAVLRHLLRHMMLPGLDPLLARRVDELVAELELVRDLVGRLHRVELAQERAPARVLQTLGTNSNFPVFFLKA